MLCIELAQEMKVNLYPCIYFMPIIYCMALWLYILSFLMDCHLMIGAFVNSFSTNTVILQVNKRGMAYQGAFKRLRNGFTMKEMMKQYMLMLQN